MAAITILDTPAANIATPSTGLTSIFVDGDSMKMKTSTGNVVIIGTGGTIVSSFNTRDGAVTLDSTDVTTALGFTPYNATNPSGYITEANVNLTLVGDVTASGNTSGNITTTLSNTAVTAGVYGDTSHVAQITVDAKGRVTSASNVAFSAGSNFDGNLKGNALYSSGNNVVTLSAYPLSSLSPVTGSNLNFQTHPTYTSGVLQNQGQQSIGTITQANVILATANGTSKTYTVSSVLNQVNATGSMNANDKTRALVAVNSIALNGQTWGHTTSPNATAAHASYAAYTEATGAGTVGHMAGISAVVYCNPGSSNSQNVDYMTGVASSLVTSGPTPTAANITTARGMVVGINPSFGTVTNAIGVHIPSGWATPTGSGAVTNKYSILVEDSASPIKSNSAISTTSTMTVGNYASTAMPTGSIGMIVAVNDNGGKLAYWDGSNSRWSYVFDNSAV